MSHVLALLVFAGYRSPLADIQIFCTIPRLSHLPSLENTRLEIPIAAEPHKTLVIHAAVSKSTPPALSGILVRHFEDNRSPRSPTRHHCKRKSVGTE